MPKASQSDWRQKLSPILAESIKQLVSAVRSLLAMFNALDEIADETPSAFPGFSLHKWHRCLESLPTYQKFFKALPVALQNLSSRLAGGITSHQSLDMEKETELLGKALNEKEAEKLVADLKTSDMFYMLRAIQIAISARYIFHESLPQLIQKAKAGDDSALCRLVQLEKTFTSSPWVVERIWKAQLAGEWRFFQKLGRALGNHPKTTRRRQNVLETTLELFGFALENLTFEELREFLIHVELVGANDPERNLRQLLRLYGFKFRRIK